MNSTPGLHASPDKGGPIDVTSLFPCEPRTVCTPPLLPSNPTPIDSDPALPPHILPALQQALLSTDPHSLTSLVRRLLDLPHVTPFTAFPGPDGQPLLLGTLELFC